MARPSCNVDVWDLSYQELLVDAYCQDNQVYPTEGCDDKFITGADILAQNYKKYQIK